MNNKHIHDLTLRLAQALDQNYDVVHMDDVISVISALEGTTITKEQLETTRLAKYINHLRRRTNSEHLARRAKSLLKKWREMVGIQQQQTSEPTNASVSSFPSTINHSANTNQERRLRAQSISPAEISTNFDAIHLHHSNSNNSQNIVASVGGHTATEVISQPFLYQNALVFGHGSSTSKYAKSASQLHSSKGSEQIGGQLEMEPMLTAPSVGASINSKKQPTSFHNLLRGLREADKIIGKSTQHRNVTLKHTYVAEQSSNSNSEISCSPLTRTVNIAPIIINIQDSNSGSNLTNSVNKAANNKVAASSSKINVGKSSLNSISISHTTLISKSKRVKKDKKRKDKEIGVQNNNTFSAFNATVMTEEFSNQQRNQDINENEEKCTALADDKSRHTFPMSNISEILSLSNSSMGSVFPSEGLAHAIDFQNTKETSARSIDCTSLNVSSNDLTFAGKFNQSSSLAPVTSDFMGCNTIRVNRHAISPNLALFNNITLPFKDIGSNSNDSNFNSRISHFNLNDVHQGKALQNFCMQKTRGVSHSQQISATDGNIQMPQSSAVSQKLLNLGIDGTESNLTTIPVTEKKLPRKRGRKKGSKGVDSVIATEANLTSHMFLTSLGSGGKKVKTTKELYNEMQNRKLLGTTTSSSPALTNWHLQQQITSRPTSSCSEPSLQSPCTLDACSTNATTSTFATRSSPDKFINNNPDEGDTESDTATSELSRDSVVTQKNIRRCISINNNSNSELISIKLAECSNSITGSATAVNVSEAQLIDFLKKLPPVPSIATIELKSTSDIIPCTCKINEIIPQQYNTMELKNDDIIAKQPETVTKIGVQEKSSSEQNIAVLTDVLRQEFRPMSVQTFRSDCDIVVDRISPKRDLVPPKPKKSIFDLDFDDDDDPLLTLKAEAATVSIKQEVNITAKNLVLTAEHTGPLLTLDEITGGGNKDEFRSGVLLDKVISHLPTSKAELVPVLPTYEVAVDSNCMARQCFEIQTQKVTNFHVNALHNYFIPNVNGNWDNSNDIRLSAITNSPLICVTKCIDDYNVVPKYGSLVLENIKKDLSYLTFSKHFQPKTHVSHLEKLKSTPFLGVARKFQAVHDNKRTHKHNCHKLIHVTGNKGLEKYTVNDAYLQPESNSFVVASNNNPYNCNNIPYKDITIDVSEASVDVFIPQVSVRETGHIKQNLLAIVDNLNFNPGKHLQSNTINNKEQTKDNSTKVEHELKDDNRDRSMPTTDYVGNIEIGVQGFIDENSRRSSSSSNYSLKQTQQSINLKLKRQFQEQKIFQSKRKLKKFNSDINKYSETLVYDGRHACRKPRIKRIKIAINEDVATQMQISGGSSNNSNDEYNDENHEERTIDTITIGLDESKEGLDGGGDEDEDIKSLNSVASQYSTYKNACNSDDVDDINADPRDHNANDENEIDFEDYVDADEDYDDSEEYIGAYHEVVTRDIATPSTGNNHIVLTIKKTPSKTNSPSDSLSGMSPMAINNSHVTSLRNLISPVTSTNNHSVINNTDIDMNAITVKKLEVEDHNLQTADNTNNKKINNEITNVKIGIENESKDIYLEEESKTTSNSNEVSSEAMTFVEFDNVSYPLSPSNFLTQTATYRYKRRIRRCKRKPKVSSSPATNITATKKLHHQLFFPNELYIADNKGLSQPMLNITSCSSSCIEDGGDEYDSIFFSEQYEQPDFKQCSQVNEGSLQRCDNVTNSINKRDESRMSQCRLRASSRSSVCSTYSSEITPILNRNVINVVMPCNSTLMLKHRDYPSEVTANEDKTENNHKKIENMDSNNINNDEPSLNLPPCAVVDINCELSTENNGLLQSFNNVYCISDQSATIPEADYNLFAAVTDFQVTRLRDNKLHVGAVELKQDQQQLPSKNCDDYNKIYNTNTNNINLIKYVSNVTRLENHISYKQSDNSSNSVQQQQQRNYLQNDINIYRDKDFDFDESKVSQIRNQNYARDDNTMALTELKTMQSLDPMMLPHKEYRSGLRAVDEDVNDEDGNNCARIQQFKEWHQVLQLRSYNDELLTVLPYVVLE